MNEPNARWQMSVNARLAMGSNDQPPTIEAMQRTLSDVLRDWGNDDDPRPHLEHSVASQCDVDGSRSDVDGSRLDLDGSRSDVDSMDRASQERQRGKR